MRGVVKARPWLPALAAGLVVACGSSGGGGDGATGGGGGSGTGGTGGVSLDDMGTGGGTGDAATGGGTADMGAGGGAAGGTPSTEQPPDVRCPDLQAGHYILIGFPDRVDAYEAHDFNLSYFCTFLDLAANGITHASALARLPGDDGQFLVADTEDGKGVLHTFDADGNHVAKVLTNINLADIGGVWPKYSGDGFIAYSKSNSNLYELDADGKFVGPWQPPEAVTTRFDHLTDLLFVRADALVMSYSDKPPKVFIHPNSPEIPADEVATANAMAPVSTEAGTKLLISGEVAGAGNGFGIVLYKEVVSGRVPPELDKVLVQPGEFSDGIGLLATDGGFFVLDSAVGGAARVIGFNTGGVLQNENALEGSGNPYRILYETIFPSF